MMHDVSQTKGQVWGKEGKRVCGDNQVWGRRRKSEGSMFIAGKHAI